MQEPASEKKKRINIASTDQNPNKKIISLRIMLKSNFLYLPLKKSPIEPKEPTTRNLIRLVDLLGGELEVGRELLEGGGRRLK